jgi:serine/threonine protein kinase/tetratricopeptide (TPR) repeat protein
MDIASDQWGEVKRLFEAVLQQEPTARSSFLAQNCPDDELRGFVEKLVACHQQAGSFLGNLAINDQGSPFSDMRAATFNSGDVLASRFTIVRLIAKGGMGEVYEAKDLELHEHVAIKTIRLDILRQPRALERFKREVHLAKQVTHSNVCRIFDLVRHRPPGAMAESDDVYFVTMELLEGETLAQRLKRTTTMTMEEALSVVSQMASALGAAHDVGILHRDFKPGNVVLVPSKERIRAVVTDFGLALRSSGDFSVLLTPTTTNEAFGTPAYMSPEQIEGKELTPASDIYALGLVIYEMVTGARPFEAETPISMAVRRLTEEPMSPRSLSPGLDAVWEAVILKCLQREPANRFAKAGEVTSALTGEKVAPPRKAGKEATLKLTVILMLAAMFSLASYAFHLWHRHEGVVIPTSAPIKPRRSVAVLGFKNLSKRTETEWISTALAETLTTELAAGEQLRTIPGEEVARVKVSLSLVDADSYGEDTLSRIRKNLGADYVVLGSYLDLGKESDSQVRLDLRLQDAAAGETVAAVSETGSEAQLPDLISRTGAVLREKLGVNEVSASEASRVRAALPSNPEATRVYSEGLAKLRAFDYQAARDLLQKATTADPAFPLAHSALSFAWEKLSEKEESARMSTASEEASKDEAERAFELSADLSRENKLWVEAQYRKSKKEFDKATRIYQTLVNLFPDNIDYGLALADVERYPDALVTIKALRKLPEPARDDPRTDYTEASVAYNALDFRRAQEAANRAAQMGSAQDARLLVADSRSLECQAFLELAEPKLALASCEEARRVYAEVNDRGSLARVLRHIAQSRRRQGDLAGATMTLEEALTLSRQVGNDLAVRRTLVQLSSVLMDQGDLAGAKRRLSELVISQPFSRSYALWRMAEVLTLQGDLAGAKMRLQEALPTDIGPADIGAAGQLVDLAHILYLQADLNGARKRLNEALPVIKQLPSIYGEDRNAEALELSFLLTDSELSIEEGHASRAEELVKRVLAKLLASPDLSPWYDRWDVWDTQVEAETRLAVTLIAIGKVVEARNEIDGITGVMAKSMSRRRRLDYEVAAARILAASGHPTEAKKKLEATLSEAAKYGFVGSQLEARLALGEIDMRSGGLAAGGARLAALEKDAQAKGFLLIAHRAAAEAH